LKKLVADLSLDKEMLAGGADAKVLKPAQKRQAVHFLLGAYRISVRRGCGLLMQSRTVYHWQSRRDYRAITLRIREIAETRIRIRLPAYSYPVAAGSLANTSDLLPGRA
jgi:putative transposase